MGTETFCGIDFGTSNSAVGYLDNAGSIQLAALENGKADMPSTIFFNIEDDTTYFGREAISLYTDGDNGRFFRALKSILGSDLTSTQLNKNALAFEQLICLYLTELKNRAEAQSNSVFSKVVLGRPVNFVDGDAERDAMAQQTLESAAKKAGFKQIIFQFEPIAAALAYENAIKKEELALVVDLGAGTSDFTAIRLKTGQSLSDRQDDILATEGVHTGGGDLDKRLSLQKVMPAFGYNTPDRHRPELMLPAEHFNCLATWHRINDLYDRKVMSEIRRMLGHAQQKQLVTRLLQVVEKRRAHQVAVEVESAKISLSESDSALANLNFVEAELQIPITKTEHDEAIFSECLKIEKSMMTCLSNAGLKPAQIDTVFLTGGTSSVLKLRDDLLSYFPAAKIVDGDKFSSVAAGLALHASRIFD